MVVHFRYINGDYCGNVLLLQSLLSEKNDSCLICSSLSDANNEVILYVCDVPNRKTSSSLELMSVHTYWRCDFKES